MTTHFKDYKQSFTGSGMESLSQSLQDLASGKVPSAVNCVLTFSLKENESVTWLLKNPTVEQLLD